MTIAAQNSRAKTHHVPPARAAMPPEETPPPPQKPGAPEDTKPQHGVRSAEQQPGQAKDPTWKLLQLLDGKK